MLDTIGWRRVRALAPSYALHLRARLNDANAEDRRNRNREDRRDLSLVMRAAQQLHEAIDRLAPESRGLIDMFSGDPEAPTASDRVQRAIEEIAPGLLELAALLDAEAPGKGRRKNLAAFRIADVLAEIHTIGLGHKPTFGKDPITGYPTGAFGRACTEAFDLLGCRISGTSTEPIEAAVAKIADDHLRQLLVLGSGALSRRPPSLFDMARLRDHLGEN